MANIQGDLHGHGRRVLIVGGGPFQLDIIRAARAFGLFTVVVDGRADAPGLKLADVPLVIDTRAAAEVTQAAREHRVDGVVSAASDVAVGTVAQVAETLDLCGARPHVVRRGRDKLETFRALTAAGLAMPSTLVVTNAHEASGLVSTVGGYPCVIKPRSSAGGRGVSIVSSEEQLERAIELACSASHDGSGALLQAFADGESFGVEAFFRAGALVRAFILNDQYEPGFVSPAGHSAPSSLDPERTRLLESTVSAWGTALGLSDGPANFDLRLTAEGPVLIEANLRLGGNSITELVRVTWGVDLSIAALACALGDDPAPLLEKRHEAPTAARLLLAKTHGRIIGTRSDVTRWNAHPDVLLFELNTSGELPRVNDWSILGRCIVRGSDERAAAERARELTHEVLRDVKVGEVHDG